MSETTPAAPSPAGSGSPSMRAKLKRLYGKWEMYTAWPMFILSIIFVGVSALLIANPKDLSRTDWFTLLRLTFALWFVFAIDYFVRLVLSDDRWKFFKTQGFEMLTLMLPYLRPFLLIRYIWRLRVFRRMGASGLRIRAMISLCLFALCFVYTVSTLVFLFERVNPKANIVNWGDAIWWGFTTISTVGYGDFTPVTVPGRMLAVMLMVGGVFIVGVTSATMISAFNDSLKHYFHRHKHDEGTKDEAPSKGESILINTLTVGASSADASLSFPPGSSEQTKKS